MTGPKYDIPNISIDVIPVVFNPEVRQLQVVLGRRIYEPFIGEFALPGVLLKGSERVDEAVRRALSSKAGLGEEDIADILDVGVFDNPDRDPRGATVSITRMAVLSRVPEVTDARKIWSINSHLAVIPFDHNAIIEAGARVAAEKFLHDRDFTLSVLGKRFTTSHVKSILAQLSDASEGFVDVSNIHRILRKTGWVQVSPIQEKTEGRGRPSVWWETVDSED